MSPFLLLRSIMKACCAITICVHSLKNSDIKICRNVSIVGRSVSGCVWQGHTGSYLGVFTLLHSSCVLASLVRLSHIVYRGCCIIIVRCRRNTTSILVLKFRVCIEIVGRPPRIRLLLSPVTMIWVFILIEGLLPAIRTLGMML